MIPHGPEVDLGSRYMTAIKPGNHTNDEELLSFVSRDHMHKYIDSAADKPEPRYTDEDGPDRQDAIVVRLWLDESGRVLNKFKVQIGYHYSPPSVWDQIR